MTVPACDAYDAQKIEVVVTTDSRAQDGTPIETPHFQRGGRTITRHELAALYARETGSDDIDRYRVADAYGLTVVGLVLLGAGVAATATGGVLLLATSSSSGAHTAGWVTLVAGLALWVPSPWLIMGGSSKEESGYAFDARTARALADAYDRALARHLGTDVCAGAASTSRAPPASSSHTGVAPGASLRRVHLAPVVAPSFVGLTVRF